MGKIIKLLNFKFDEKAKDKYSILGVDSYEISKKTIDIFLSAGLNYRGSVSIALINAIDEGKLQDNELIFLASACIQQIIKEANTGLEDFLNG